MDGYCEYACMAVNNNYVTMKAYDVGMKIWM